MQKIVVDSSVIVKWLNQQDEELLEQADRLLKDVQNTHVILLAPELAKFEIGNALLQHKSLSVDGAKVTFAQLFLFPVQFISLSKDLATSTYQIAKMLKITYYDASFIALAKQEDAILVTDNVKHQGKFSEIEVTPLKDY